MLVSALLFAIGLAGAVTRRNAILALVGIELMLNAANLNFIAFWRYGPNPEALSGMMVVIFSIAIAAAEAAVGLALIIAIYRHYRTVNLDEINNLKGMTWIAQNLWLIPVLPLAASGVIAVNKQRQRKLAATLAIGSMVLAFLLSLCAFSATLLHHGDNGVFREVAGFNWLQFGGQWLQLGWVLDPLTAIMLVMVSFVSLLIFIFSVGYMAHDENFMRFFCFMSLFAAAMLGVVIANNLLLFFICWEIVGLTSYLLIGFWYHKPSAAAAAKKAFITTRIGDLGLLLGMVWLYAETGTLNFYADGNGCLEQSALTAMVTHMTAAGMAVSTAIGLLIFLGAVGKSGQLPLHVWLPDAMEGPTPVSALIHAATMVAAGVFLVARVYPLMSCAS